MGNTTTTMPRNAFEAEFIFGVYCQTKTGVKSTTNQMTINQMTTNQMTIINCIEYNTEYKQSVNSDSMEPSWAKVHKQYSRIH